MTLPITRKQFLTGAGATAGAVALGAHRARAARPTVIKLGTPAKPDDPTAIHYVAAGEEIKKATNGEVELQVFPNGELGDDSHTLSEVRTGAIQMMGVSDVVISVLVPSVAIDNIGFAFKDVKTAFAAMDGAVGDVVRADIEKRGLHPMRAMWNLGFREITSGTKPIASPADLKGFKIRVPVSALSVSLFRDLGAAPVTMNVAELYTSLQTHVVNGQENPLDIIETQKFYEVQKYCSLTNHMWSGWWIVMNQAFWKRLPADHQKAIAAAFESQATKQRAAVEAFNGSLQAKLTKQGMTFNATESAPFRAMLVKAGFYDEWHKKFGSELWNALEKYTGTLA